MADQLTPGLGLDGLSWMVVEEPREWATYQGTDQELGLNKFSDPFNQKRLSMSKCLHLIQPSREQIYRLEQARTSPHHLQPHGTILKLVDLFNGEMRIYRNNVSYWGDSRDHVKVLNTMSFPDNVPEDIRRAAKLADGFNWSALDEIRDGPSSSAVKLGKSGPRKTACDPKRGHEYRDGGLTSSQGTQRSEENLGIAFPSLRKEDNSLSPEHRTAYQQYLREYSEVVRLLEPTCNRDGLYNYPPGARDACAARQGAGIFVPSNRLARTFESSDPNVPSIGLTVHMDENNCTHPNNSPLFGRVRISDCDGGTERKSYLVYSRSYFTDALLKKERYGPVIRDVVDYVQNQPDWRTSVGPDFFEEIKKHDVDGKSRITPPHLDKLGGYLSVFAHLIVDFCENHPAVDRVRIMSIIVGIVASEKPDYYVASFQDMDSDPSRYVSQEVIREFAEDPSKFFTPESLSKDASPFAVGRNLYREIWRRKLEAKLTAEPPRRRQRTSRKSKDGARPTDHSGQRHVCTHNSELDDCKFDEVCQFLLELSYAYDNVPDKEFTSGNDSHHISKAVALIDKYCTSIGPLLAHHIIAVAGVVGVLPPQFLLEAQVSAGTNCHQILIDKYGLFKAYVHPRTGMTAGDSFSRESHDLLSAIAYVLGCTKAVAENALCKAITEEALLTKYRWADTVFGFQTLFTVVALDPSDETPAYTIKWTAKHRPRYCLFRYKLDGTRIEYAPRKWPTLNKTLPHLPPSLRNNTRLSDPRKITEVLDLPVKDVLPRRRARNRGTGLRRSTRFRHGTSRRQPMFQKYAKTSDIIRIEPRHRYGLHYQNVVSHILGVYHQGMFNPSKSDSAVWRPEKPHVEERNKAWWHCALKVDFSGDNGERVTELWFPPTNGMPVGKDGDLPGEDYKIISGKRHYRNLKLAVRYLLLNAVMYLSPNHTVSCWTQHVLVDVGWVPTELEIAEADEEMGQRQRRAYDDEEDGGSDWSRTILFSSYIGCTHTEVRSSFPHLLMKVLDDNRQVALYRTTTAGKKIGPRVILPIHPDEGFVYAGVVDNTV